MSRTCLLATAVCVTGITNFATYLSTAITRTDSEDIAVGSSSVFCTLDIDSKPLFFPADIAMKQKSTKPLYSELPAKYAVLFSKVI